MLLLLDKLKNQGGEKMKGNIRTKEICPKCGKRFQEIKHLGYICRECETIPKKFYLDLPHNGKRRRIFVDKTGQPLDSYKRALGLQELVNYEIKGHSFDPSKYCRTSAQDFWVANLLDRFYESRKGSMAPSYQKDFKRMVCLGKEFFGTMDVREVRKLYIMQYQEHLVKAHQWSQKTLKNTLDVFKAFLNWCREELEILDIVPAFPRVVCPEPKTRWLSNDAQIEVFKCVPEMDRPIVQFLMLHPCRPGEARALRCCDVDSENMTITVSATFSKNTFQQKRKGRESRSVTIPVHPEMFDFFAEKVTSNLPLSFIFVNPRTGTPYSQDALGRLWQNVRKAAGLDEEFRLYDATRHSAASQLVNSGSSLYTISRLLGHSNTKTTERYSHPDVESMRAEQSKLSLKDRTVTKPSPNSTCVSITSTISNTYT